LLTVKNATRAEIASVSGFHSVSSIFRFIVTDMFLTPRYLLPMDGEIEYTHDQHNSRNHEKHILVNTATGYVQQPVDGNPRHSKIHGRPQERQEGGLISQNRPLEGEPLT